MLRFFNRLPFQLHRTDPCLAPEQLCRLVQQVAAISLLATVCAFAEFSPTEAAPRTGPDRPFTVDWQVTVPPAPHLRAAAFVPGTMNAIVVGDSGTILRTDDGGKSWKRPVLNFELKPSLLAMAFTSPLGAVAVGENGAIVRTSDGGQTWALVTPTATPNHLRAVTFADAMIGIAVGDAGTILRTQDGGKTWHRPKAPSEGVGGLKAVTFGNAGNGIAVGTDETILRTIDGGESWQQATLAAVGVQTRPRAQGKLTLSAVLTVSETIVIAAGEGGKYRPRQFPPGEHPIIRSEDGGKTWQHAALPSGIAVDVSAIVSMGGMNAFAVGSGANVWHSEDGTASSASGFGGAVLSTDDGGQNWKRVALQSGSARDLQSIAFVSDKTGIAVGAGGSILRTDDRGANWIRATLPAGPNLGFEVIAIADGDHAIVTSDDGVILWTQDGARSFERSVLPAGIETDTFRAVALTGSTNGIAIGARANILRTEDRGKSWQEVRAQPNAEADLNAVKFVNALTGITVGQAGTILRTDDGGKSWERGKIPPDVKSDLLELAFVDSAHAVAVGNDGTILTTADGGRVWERSMTGVAANLRAVAFSGPAIGIAIGDGGTILRSGDGGKSWEPAKRPLGLGGLSAIAYADALHGIAVGDVDNTQTATIVWTADGGKSWEAAKRPSRLGNLRAVAFSGGLNAVAVGDSQSVDDVRTGTIVWTADGGKNWERSTFANDEAPPDANFSGLALTAVSTGVAVGGGTILSTRDNGKKWSRASVLARPQSLDVRYVALDGTTGFGIAAGGRGVLIASEAPNYAAYLDGPNNSVRQNLNGGIELDLHTVDEEGDAVRAVAVEYNVVRDRGADWKPLARGLTKSSADGHWRMTWSPGDEVIGNDARIEHRVFIDDGGPPLEAIMLNPVVFRSLWDRVSEYRATLWSGAGIAAVIALYLIPILLLFWLAPARLALAGSGTLDAVGTAAEAWSKAISALLRQLALPWFKRRPRVRNAWLNAYRERTTRFDKLAKEIREEFLKQDDVLDAWVAHRLSSARNALAQLPLYRARAAYIPFPVRKGDASTGETIDQPGPGPFEQVFCRGRAVLSIVGGGGSGKTTLACALARWAMADAPGRLMAHSVIPVVVAEETKDLVATVAAGLSRMVGSAEEIEPDIVHALLRRKRVLVIVDALSERSAETQQHVYQLYGSDTPINALIVTTRREPQFGPVEQTLVFPQPIDLRLLVPFIMEYLKREELTSKFEPRQQLALAQRILEIVEHGGGLTVTPLLVTLFVDTAVARAGPTGQIENLPVDVPEVYLDYLDRLNPVDPATPNWVDRETMHEAAFILAETSLGADLVPTDFRREQAERRLGESRLDSAHSLTDRLIANGVVQERLVAGLSMLRFQFDPVAEYLAAIAKCRTLGHDKAPWLTMIAELTTMQSYPDVIRGYLSALSVCYESYKLPLKLAVLEFPWTASKRNGARPD
jgi:photosystem II stability/assembly factor-like uncharacterized protein